MHTTFYLFISILGAAQFASTHSSRSINKLGAHAPNYPSPPTSACTHTGPRGLFSSSRDLPDARKEKPALFRNISSRRSRATPRKKSPRDTASLIRYFSGASRGKNGKAPEALLSFRFVGEKYMREKETVERANESTIYEFHGSRCGL